MKELKWNITKVCKEITESGKDEYTGNDVTGCLFKFRLLNEAGVVCAYGKSNKESSFAPLNACKDLYGCTKIQYWLSRYGAYSTLKDWKN